MNGDRDSPAGEALPPATAEEDPRWGLLRRSTVARIGLKRAGSSLATAPLLDFRLAQARARDAVHASLDTARLADSLRPLKAAVLIVSSGAQSRQDYLMRPDLGRMLDAGGVAALAPYAGESDIVFVVADGLSAGAVQSHAEPVLERVLPSLAAQGLRCGPVVVVRHGRVAIGDQIASALGAACAAVLIGERPGLSAPDSMGAYLTWQPGARTTDADRNCISNIRPAGIGYADAAFKIVHLVGAMRASGRSGVRLKDTSDRIALESPPA